MAVKSTSENKKRTRKATSEKKDQRNSANKSNPNTVTSNRLELLVTVVNKKKAEFYTDLLQDFDVNMHVTAFGHGTADAKMLGYLGLTDNEKAVIFSVVQQNMLRSAMDMLEYKFKTIKDGKGIAFTIPLTSVIGTLIFRFLSNNRMAVKEEK